MTTQSSVNLLFLLIIIPDVILEAPNVQFDNLPTYGTGQYDLTYTQPDNHWAHT